MNPQNASRTNASNFSIGGNNTTFHAKSAHREQFGHSPNAQDLQVKTDFVRSMKADHFSLGSAAAQPKEQFKTLNQNYFRSPAHKTGVEASAFAQEWKQELMKNHFDFGSPTLLKTS